ncbi:hypothetical protein [Bradyrhizobium sp.]|uniref:hypothetical protein n=1 Tax=Bradyrhizobium sp. TaxID=376 RepID=UPI004037D012
MNATIDQKPPLSPNDPAYYAPRAPRDADSARLPRLGETPAYRAPATSITDTTLDVQLEDAVRESLRHPLDPQSVEEPPEIERSGVLGVVGRFAAAVGAAAFVALLFVIVIPSLQQQPSTEPSAAELIDSMKAAISRSEQAARPREPQPSPELQSILASSDSAAPVSPQESEALLKQFMQWQQKPADAQDKQ